MADEASLGECVGACAHAAHAARADGKFYQTEKKNVR